MPKAFTIAKAYSVVERDLPEQKRTKHSAAHAFLNGRKIMED